MVTGCKEPYAMLPNINSSLTKRDVALSIFRTYYDLEYTEFIVSAQYHVAGGVAS
jgi:hypothetical protein